MKDLKTIVKVAITVAFLLLCTLIPSWFVPSAPPEPTPDVTETVFVPAADFASRAALFSANFIGNEIKGREFEEEDLDADSQQACEDLISYILDAVIVDIYPEDRGLHAGIDLKTVYGDDGTYIRLVRYFREWNSDWINWIDIVIDADTRDIYYIYISSSCLQNHKRYPDMPDQDTLIELITSLTGSAPRITGESFDGEDWNTSCVFTTERNGAVEECAYDIIGHSYYDDVVPSRLFDYKIICAPDANMLQKRVETDTTR